MNSFLNHVTSRLPNSSNAAIAPEVIVRLQKVSKVYDENTPCLQDINLHLKRGDFLFITGSSGTGKSTLLKLLYGEERATSGRVYVNGYNMDKLKGDRLAKFRRRVGVVFQDYKLISNRTVFENIAFVLQAQGRRKREIERRVLPTLKMVGLAHKAAYFPDQLSGGEQQRVSLARAIVGTPPLLLADEPTGNLDSDNARQILRTLLNLNTYGATVIVTTHDTQLAHMSKQPIIQLRQGRLYWLKRVG
ncbi:cell division ATP-binding protein FtsE [Spirulina sp. CS-785/01]|uniref:cell division ATP-binding protein FtsE n=1 Tax=Spirulina sp. CS-785/01 TaxID=3021716 RepID=UPI00232DDF4F|nr:cell division ATP-binding protein FtsE [Spirulina sp. CS-785/01]MDB9315468.1 cell division ATP-binding protein FtsE [Spirulina sp. CS-785/01]